MKCKGIHVEGLGKKYQNKWIFKNLSYDFEENKSYAIKGPNGSGKSTLLKILSGYLSPSRGQISFNTNQKSIPIDEVYQSISFTAPYIALMDRLTMEENIKLLLKFRKLKNNISSTDLINLINLKKAKNKEIRYFSSGMMQRLKLAMSICSDTPVLLLDEPTSNLDDQGMEWYKSLVNEYRKDRITIVASNVNFDFDFCEEGLNLLSYKKL